MITAFASLALTPSWREDQLAVVCATDALRLCREGGFEALPRHQAGSFLGNLGRREDGSVRAFISRARLSGAPLSGFEDGELLALLHDRVLAAARLNTQSFWRIAAFVISANVSSIA